MFKKTIYFIKYNNAVVLIVLAVFLITGGVFAQTEAGQDLIGEKQTRVSGEDNTLLLEVDLDVFNMDFKISKISRDEKYHYVTYTYLDIVKENAVWQYVMKEKQRKVPVNIEMDLGEYLVEELSEQFESRLAELRRQKNEELTKGQSVRQEITEYNGLLGKTLNIVDAVFPDYESVKKVELPSPSNLALSVLPEGNTSDNKPDDLTNIYLDYINEVDPDNDSVFGDQDNCPFVSNSEQLDSDKDGIGDGCDLPAEVLPTIEETPLSDENIPETNEGTGNDTTKENESIPTSDENNDFTNDNMLTPEPEASVEIIELNQ